jgi:prepilin-type N-terminal cleavage/methylation domain-containing protein
MRVDLSDTETGFTLVEVLVALVVTSLLLGIVMNAAITAGERGKHAGVKREALMLAREIAGRRAADAPEQGTRTGTEGTLTWRSEEAVAAMDPARRYVLADILVAVGLEGQPPLVSARTRKLKQVPAR